MEAREMMIGGRAAKRIELGGAVLWEKADDAKMPDGLVCWYDVARQGCTNKSLRREPWLVDLSGNGYDMELHLRIVDGVTDLYQDAIYFGTNGQYGHVPIFPALADYTIIAKRELTGIHDVYGTFLSTANNDSGLTGWEFEIMSDLATGTFEANNVWRKGGMRISPPKLYTWGTLTSYNGVYRIEKEIIPPRGIGTQLTVGERWPNGGNRQWCNYLYKLMIFDRSLPTDTILGLIDKYFIE